MTVLLHEGLDGNKGLTERERYDLDRDVRRQPWEFHSESFLFGDFDQWFAKTVYEVSGRLSWRGRYLKPYE